MITVREARPEDTAAVCALSRESLGYNLVSEAEFAENFAHVLKQPFYRVFVAEFEGAVAGYVQGSDYDCAYAPPMKDVLGLAVFPAYAAKGIGRALMRALEDWAREEGCAGVRLVSGWSRTGAHAFYERLGYVSRKDQKNFVKLFEE